MHSNELQFKLNQKEKLILELEKVVLNYRKKTQILQFADENTRLKKENATLLEDKRNSKNLTAEVVQMISLHMVDTFPYVPADYKPPKGDYKNCYNAIRHIQSHIEAYMAKCDGRKSNRAEGLKKKYQQFTKLKENFDKAWTMIENSQATDVNLSDDTPRDKSSESGIIEVQQSGDSSVRLLTIKFIRQYVSDFHRPIQLLIMPEELFIKQQTTVQSLWSWMLPYMFQPISSMSHLSDAYPK